jgi:hypothetical protein
MHFKCAAAIKRVRVRCSEREVGVAYLILLARGNVCLNKQENFSISVLRENSLLLENIHLHSFFRKI